MSRIITILPASGSSSRMGLGPEYPSKLLIPLSDGRSVLEHTLKLLHDSELRSLVIPTTEDLAPHVQKILTQVGEWDHVHVIRGGETRFLSVSNALDFIDKNLIEKNFEFVAIHDAARPKCPQSLIETMLTNLSSEYGIIPALPIINTVKQVDEEGFVITTLNRDQLFEVQTPQMFPLTKLIDAYHFANENTEVKTFFDDASVFEIFGLLVRIIPGSSKNTKITYPDDIAKIKSVIV